jgi:hypothetical protein
LPELISQNGRPAPDSCDHSAANESTISAVVCMATTLLTPWPAPQMFFQALLSPWMSEKSILAAVSIRLKSKPDRSRL